MTKKLELYRCNVCKNLVEIILEGNGELSCCNQAMERLEAGGTDGTKEKHVPVFDFECENLGVKIRVGSEEHPMIEEHYIQFVEVISPNQKTLHREYLHPNEAPEILVNCRSNLIKQDGLCAREYCNIHGLFKNN